MFAKRSRISLFLAASLLLVTGCSQAETANQPPALKALEDGVRAVVILDGRRPHAMLVELFSEYGAGTLVTAG